MWINFEAFILEVSAAAHSIAPTRARKYSLYTPCSPRQAIHTTHVPKALSPFVPPVILQHRADTADAIMITKWGMGIFEFPHFISPMSHELFMKYLHANLDDVVSTRLLGDLNGRQLQYPSLDAIRKASGMHHDLLCRSPQGTVYDRKNYCAHPDVEAVLKLSFQNYDPENSLVYNIVTGVTFPCI